jgi:hypothetical protein
LSPDPQADPQAVGFSSGAAAPQAAGASAGLSPDPQAVPQALVGWLDWFHPYRFESAIVLTSKNGIQRVFPSVGPMISVFGGQNKYAHFYNIVTFL